MWILNLAQHVDRVPFTHGPHGRDEISEAVDRQQRRTIKRRDKETARKMCAMMFDVVKASAQLFFGHIKTSRQFVFQISYSCCIAKPVLDLRSCETGHARC